MVEEPLSPMQTHGSQVPASVDSQRSWSILKTSIKEAHWHQILKDCSKLITISFLRWFPSLQRTSSSSHHFRSPPWAILPLQVCMSLRVPPNHLTWIAKSSTWKKSVDLICTVVVDPGQSFDWSVGVEQTSGFRRTHEGHGCTNAYFKTATA